MFDVKKKEGKDYIFSDYKVDGSAMITFIQNPNLLFNFLVEMQKK